MITKNSVPKNVLLHVLKEFSSAQTITSVAKELGLSRVGVWKVLKRLEENKYITLKAVGKGRTSASLISLNWENPLVEKTLSLYLAEEAVKHRRWQVNFIELEKVMDFVILYGSIVHSPQNAGDIDILGVAPKKNFMKIQEIIDKIQKTQSKKVHFIMFTESECRTELKKPNKVFIDAIKKGVILCGQDSFVKFIYEMIK